MNILTRRQILINTDPQRRCYNGCHFSSEFVWTPWEILEYEVAPEKLERRMQFWRELNDYAVSQRGQGARCEFTLEESK
jgi:hypothetical protein